MTVINRVSRLLGERHLNAMDLHRGTGIAYNACWKLARGRALRLDLHTLDRLCEFLGVGPEEIFEYVPNPPPSPPPRAEVEDTKEAPA